MARPKTTSPLRILLIVLAVFIGAGAIVYNFFPRLALDGISALYELRSGVASREIDVDGYRMPYYEGGTGDETVVLVHGYGDTRLAFLQSSQWLNEKYHVVMPTLPGFGSTRHDPERDHGIRSQVEALRAFVDALGLKQFHLGGNSMGGHISAAFALRYPERVKKLMLFNPAGLLVDDPVPYKPVEAPMRTQADWDRWMKDVFVKPPWAPAPFVKLFIANSQKNFEWSNSIRAQIRGGDDYILNDRIGKIQARTLVFWGKHDGVINVVHAPVWEKGVPNARLVIWDDVGHSPQYEYPHRTAELMLEFLGQ